MIDHILIQNFRNILHLDYTPKTFNIIKGNRGSGKSSFLEAIALVDSSDQEFHALLRESGYEGNKDLKLEQIINLNFFSHQPNLESFKIKLNINTLKTRLLEIWKVDNEINRSLGLSTRAIAPFLFVFDAIVPAEFVPNARSYQQISRYYEALKEIGDRWPVQYITSFQHHSLTNITKLYKNLQFKVKFSKTMRTFLSYYDDIEYFRVSSQQTKEMLMVKLRNRSMLMPISTCSKSMIRALTILTMIYSTNKTYFLIDDIEAEFDNDELFWFIGLLTQVAKEKQMQLFISSKNPNIDQYFDRSIREDTELFDQLDLSVVWKISDIREVVDHA